MTLPMEKLSLALNDSNEPRIHETRKEYVVLVSTGSFNPPTYMHLRCFELARDALNSDGYCVIGGYMSPVNDAYKKKGLISAEHRIAMCNLACRSSEFVMVDSWEASQASYQRTLTILSRIRTLLCESCLVCSDSLKVMLVCGSDLLESFTIPGAWIPDQVRSICRDFGLVCIRRGGQDVEKVISKDDILNEYKGNIRVVDEVVQNGISSTGLRFSSCRRMMSLKDWVLSQLVSKSLAVSRPLSASDTFLSDEPSNGEFSNQAISMLCVNVLLYHFVNSQIFFGYIANLIRWSCKICL